MTTSASSGTIGDTSTAPTAGGRPGPSVSDFSSAEYRFSTETSFEWLLPSSQIVPLVLDHFDPLSSGVGWRVLHVGCGTSSLGRDVEMALKEACPHPGGKVEVVDTDYVADSIFHSSTTDTGGIMALDCLDLAGLRAKSPGKGWDMILDKSTADAISCGPLFLSPSPGGVGREPLDILLCNLAEVTRVGTKWISISYSATRYSHLTPDHHPWKVVEKRFLASTSLPEGRRILDRRTGEERIVWEPETGVWGWVLERL